MLYMTTYLPALSSTLLLWAKEPEFRNTKVPVFDLLINPGNSFLFINLNLINVLLIDWN